MLAALLHLHTPFDPLHGDGYLWWSGLGSGSAWIAGLVMWWRHVTCHAPRCWRVGRHRTADGQWVLCRKHHPDLPNRRPSLEQIQATHVAAKVRKRHMMSNDIEQGRTTSHDTW